MAATGVVSRYDEDNDRTLDLAEVKAAGAREFAAADPDHDATLDAKELASKAGRMLKHLID